MTIAVPSSLEDLLNSSQVIVRGSASDAEVRTKRIPPNQPWREGENLMLRIRNAGPHGVARVSLRSSAVDPVVRHWVPLTDEISPSPADQDAGAPRFYAESGPPGEGETPVVMPLLGPGLLRDRILRLGIRLHNNPRADGGRRRNANAHAVNALARWPVAGRGRERGLTTGYASATGAPTPC